MTGRKRDKEFEFYSFDLGNSQVTAASTFGTKFLLHYSTRENFIKSSVCKLETLMEINCC